MKLVFGLIALLGICVVLGIVRKFRGGTFFPPQDHDGAHIKDKSGRWWRYNEESDSLEEVFRRPRK